MKKSPHGIYLVVALSLTLAAIVALYLISQTERIQVIDRANSPVVSADTLAAGPSAYLLTELQQYRSFIEVERREYQQFLTRMYATIGVLIAALGGILTFLGLKTLEDLKRKSGEQIAAVQAKINQDFEQALHDVRQKSEQEVELARQQIVKEAKEEMHRELDRLLKEELAENEKVGKALAALGRRQALWSGASIRIIGSSEMIEEMTEGGVIPYFQKASANVLAKAFDFEEDLSPYDAVVYCYEPLDFHDGAGTKHDPYAAETIKAAQKAQTPLVIYTYRQGSQDNRMDQFTLTAINAYLRGTAANFPASLIANTYDAITLYGQPTE